MGFPRSILGNGEDVNGRNWQEAKLSFRLEIRKMQGRISRENPEKTGQKRRKILERPM